MRAYSTKTPASKTTDDLEKGYQTMQMTNERLQEVQRAIEALTAEFALLWIDLATRPAPNLSPEQAAIRKEERAKLRAGLAHVRAELERQGLKADYLSFLDQPDEWLHARLGDIAAQLKTGHEVMRAVGPRLQ